MPMLFDRGSLGAYLDQRLIETTTQCQRIDEDDFLSESADSLVDRLTDSARVETLKLLTSEWVDAHVSETRIDMSHDHRYAKPWGGKAYAKGTKVVVELAWEGNGELFFYRPSRTPMGDIEAQLGTDTLAITYQCVGVPEPEDVRREIAAVVAGIEAVVERANHQVDQFNATVEPRIRDAVERRRRTVLARRDLAGSLGFPLRKRADAPRRVPITRKVIGPRRRLAKPKEARTFEDEYALDDADYEDIVALISGLLGAFENTPSVVVSAHEESLRDQILVMLNGTYEGGATGETFVKSGKTDILVRVEGRHVFVGECKWWDGTVQLGKSVDQLLGYLPWRDEKAALVVFIGRKGVEAVIEKLDAAVQAHPSFRRHGPASTEPSRRRNYVLAGRDDPDKEIHLAVLLAALPQAQRGRDD